MKRPNRKETPLTTIDLEKVTLDAGGHESPEEGMCVTELASLIDRETGLVDYSRPMTDHPPCVSPAIGAFMRSWNDSLGDEDRQLLKPYALKILETNTTPEDEERRAWLATDWLVRTFSPVWLDKAGLDEHAQKLRDLRELTSSELAKAAQPIIEAARKDAAAAWDAAWDAARAAARAAAWAAARAAARDAARAAAWDAAWAAAWAAAKEHKTYNEQFAAAYAAAKPLVAEAFGDTVKELQASAFELLERMIAVGRDEESAAA